MREYNVNENEGGPCMAFSRIVDIVPFHSIPHGHVEVSL